MGVTLSDSSREVASNYGRRNEFLMSREAGGWVKARGWSILTGPAALTWRGRKASNLGPLRKPRLTGQERGAVGRRGRIGNTCTIRIYGPLTGGQRE